MNTKNCAQISVRLMPNQFLECRTKGKNFTETNIFCYIGDYWYLPMFHHISCLHELRKIYQALVEFSQKNNNRDNPSFPSFQLEVNTYKVK